MRDWRYDSADDVGLEPSLRLRHARREPGLVGRLMHASFALLARGYFRFCHRLRIEGRQHLPDSPPFVIVANHSSMLDAIAVQAALPLALSRRTFALAAGDVFFERLPAAFFAALFVNALPMWRGRARPTHLTQLRERLQARPCGMIVFPEGTRARDGKLAAFKPGIGMLVAGSAVPVVPCAILGAYEALPPGRRWPRRHPIHLSFSRPLEFSALANDGSGWRATAHSLQDAVETLLRG